MRHEHVRCFVGETGAFDHFAGELILGADGFGGGDMGEVPGAVGALIYKALWPVV